MGVTLTVEIEELLAIIRPIQLKQMFFALVVALDLSF
jgi:hypothetical protein